MYIFIYVSVAIILLILIIIKLADSDWADEHFEKSLHDNTKLSDCADCLKKIDITRIRHRTACRLNEKLSNLKYLKITHALENLIA